MVNKVQPCQEFPPLIVKLIRLDGRVNEINEVQLPQEFAPLMINSVTVPPMMNVFKPVVLQILLPAIVRLLSLQFSIKLPSLAPENELFEIIFKAMKDGKDQLECQDLLIDANLESFAGL